MVSYMVSASFPLKIDCRGRLRFKKAHEGIAKERGHSSLTDFRRIELLRTDFGNTLRMFGADREGGEVFLRR